MSELLDAPEWLDKSKRIIEPVFCDWFLDCYPMRCIHGFFYTVDGLVAEETSIKRDIYNAIEEYVDAGIAKKVDHLFSALKIRAYSEVPSLQTDRIHVANGTYHMDGTFTEDKEFCMNRLAVGYVPDAPTPTRWLQFLSELLYEEDIPTMQEYLGYCLLPTTKGQKMLMLVGKGGEGKSRIGLVMNAIFGSSMNTTSIQKVETNRFARADLES
ncbi:MAG: DNA primase, partial [Firmicutes bacterium]|nr:DNA primase [Bacillota bacterium]